MKFTDEQYTTINWSTAGRFDQRVFVNCLQVACKLVSSWQKPSGRNVLQLINSCVLLISEFRYYVYQRNCEPLQHQYTVYYCCVVFHCFKCSHIWYKPCSCALLLHCRVNVLLSLYVLLPLSLHTTLRRGQWQQTDSQQNSICLQTCIDTYTYLHIQ